VRAVVGDGCDAVVVGDAARSEAGVLLAEVAQRRTWSSVLLTERLTDPVYVAAALVGTGVADAAVAGSSRPEWRGDPGRHPRHRPRTGLRRGTLSSSFLLRTVAGDSLCFGDCGGAGTGRPAAR